MFQIAAKHDRNIADFLNMLYFYNGTIIKKTVLYNKWKSLVAYQKKSEKEIRDIFEKLFFAFSQNKTRYTNRKIINIITNDVGENRYRISNVTEAMIHKTCYGNKLPVDMSKEEIEHYGSLSNLRKFAIISFIIQILKYCKNAEFDWGLLENILGITKTEVKKYFKRLPVTRNIGIQESKDLELDINAFTLSRCLGWNIQTGFRLISCTGVEFMDFGGILDIESMSSIVDRLETKTYCIYNGRWNRPLCGDAAMNTSRVYHTLRQVTAYKNGGKRSRASSFVKMLAEVTNLGQLKNCKNIVKNRNKYVPSGSSISMRNHLIERTLRRYNHQYNYAVINDMLSIRLY